MEKKKDILNKAKNYQKKGNDCNKKIEYIRKKLDDTKQESERRKKGIRDMIRKIMLGITVTTEKFKDYMTTIGLDRSIMKKLGGKKNDVKKDLKEMNGQYKQMIEHEKSLSMQMDKLATTTKTNQAAYDAAKAAYDKATPKA